MQGMPDLIWREGEEEITLSPRYGGRVVSWLHQGEELVHPIVNYEGGLFRILFAEEQYPGASYMAPHQVLDWQTTANGFRARLRHYWNTPGWFMRAAGWPEKANELHIDGLLLDKVISYDPERACFTCNITITNLSDETKYLTPWVHLSLAPWAAQHWMVVNGERQDYNDTDIYWGSHRVPPDATVAVVQATADGDRCAVLGANSRHLRGLSSMLPIPGEFHQSAPELRGAGIELAPGRRFRMNCFLAITDDWQAVAGAPPVELYSTIEPVSENAAPVQLNDMLQFWMLPEEEERGLMVLSFLDKPPFYSEARFAAAHSFAGFHEVRGADGDGAAQAHVMLYTARELSGVSVALGGGVGWQLTWGGEEGAQLALDLKAHDYLPLTLSGPRDLQGKESVAVTIAVPGQEPLVLRVDSQAVAEAPRPYQVRQQPTYLELRYRDKLGPTADAGPDAIRAWQEKLRGRLRQWLEFNAYGDCDLEPHLLERQEGPTCIREKWVVQTEPGIYIPGYLVRPRGATGRLPLIYFLHGSGPGKDGFAGDELERPLQTMFGHELENMPYTLARNLQCLVYVPDGRGQGEQGETDPGRWSARIAALGIDNASLRLRDQIRALDWLVQREDVDTSRIGSCGCSGGGGLTYTFAAADERVRVSIVSSTTAARPVQPAPPGWFHRMLLDKSERIEPYGIEPITGAPMGMLIAPRPMWIVDGIDDLGVPAASRPAWRRQMQQGRDAIRRVYDSLGAGESFVDNWLEGGHCAGMTHLGVADWFRKWF